MIGGWPQFICDQTRYNLGSRFLEELPEESLKWVGRVPKAKPTSWGTDFASLAPERVRQDARQQGQLVFNAKFGQGSDARAQINFNPHGVKWLALAVAKLTALE